MRNKVLVCVGMIAASVSATAGVVSEADIVKALIRDGHVSPECVRSASPKDTLIELRVETDSDGKNEYVATGTHACTCGGSLCFEWIYAYDGRTLTLKESYQLMR